MYAPFAPVFRWRTSFVPIFVMVMRALGTTAPLVSVTFPLIPPRFVCASAPGLTAKRNHNADVQRKIQDKNLVRMKYHAPHRNCSQDSRNQRIHARNK